MKLRISFLETIIVKLFLKSSKEKIKTYFGPNPKFKCTKCKAYGLQKVFGSNDTKLYRYVFLGSVYLELVITCSKCNELINKQMIKGESSLDYLK